MAQHRHKRVSEFQNLLHHRLDRFSGRAPELILFLAAAATLEGDGVVQFVVLGGFVFRVGCLVRDGEVFQISLIEC